MSRLIRRTGTFGLVKTVFFEYQNAALTPHGEPFIFIQHTDAMPAPYPAKPLPAPATSFIKPIRIKIPVYA